MPIDENSTLKNIEKSISDLEDSLTSRIDGKKISPISKIPFKVVALTFSLHHRAVDLAKNSLELYRNEDYLASAILIRSLMETTSLVFLTKKKVYQAIESKSLEEIDEFVMKGTFGGRTDDAPRKSPNILTAIDHTAKEHEKYRKLYDELSEFVHPNWFGTAGLYSKNDFENEGRVSFGKNINSSKPKFILAHFLTGLVVLRITFSDFKKKFDDFIKISEDDIKKDKSK